MLSRLALGREVPFTYSKTLRRLTARPLGQLFRIQICALLDFYLFFGLQLMTQALFILH